MAWFCRVHCIISLKANKLLFKEDFYGQYVIDRNYFKGIQANWQYNNFKFEIKKKAAFIFT
jgi:hypothetical protein